MFYLFDDTANMQDIQTLKCDLFIDLPQFIQKPGNRLEIGLASERNENNGRFSWEINISSLQKGWNSLELDISHAKKSGKVSLDSVKTVYLRFTALNLSAENYESIVIGLDNLRYLSKNGNTTLKINGADSDESTVDFGNYDAGESNDDYGFDDTGYSVIEEEMPEPIRKTITTEPKTIHLKQTVHKNTTNYLLAIIVLGAEFLAYTAISAGILLVARRKKQKQIRAKEK